MTRTQLIELLPKIKTGYKILVRPYLREGTVTNTHGRMLMYAGKTLTIDRIRYDYVYAKEDDNAWMWDHNHIVKILPAKRLKRKSNG